MRKKVTAFLLCMCLVTAGTPWNVSAENVQETVEGTEAAVMPEETENAADEEATETAAPSETEVTPEETENAVNEEETEEPEAAEEPVTKGRTVEYSGTVAVSGDDAEILHSGTWNGIIWSLDSNGKLVLDGCSEDYRLSYNEYTPWYDYRYSIVSAEIKGSGWKSADHLLYGCSDLRQIDMDSWDTSSVTHMEWVFRGCSSLTSLDVSGFDTGNVTSMGAMFDGCSSLMSLDVSGFDTGSVTFMGSMFRECRSLTSLDVSGLDTGNVMSMSAMFSGCSSLTSLDVSRLDTGNVEYMASMFEGCSSLTSLDVSGFDTSNVERMEYMFRDCSSLTSLDVGGLDTGSVTSMGAMFYGCSSLTSLDGFDMRHVRWQDSWVFYGCGSLTGNIEIPEGVTSIGSGVLYGCSSLTGSIEIPESVESIGGGAFSGCSGLTGSLEIPESVESIRGGAFSGCSGLTGSLEIPESVESIGSSAFFGCNGLTEPIDIPVSVMTIGSDAFEADVQKTITVHGTYTEIDSNGLGSQNIIYGYSGSTAEAYVQNDGSQCTFYSLGEPKVTEYRVTTIEEFNDALQPKAVDRRIILADGIYRKYSIEISSQSHLTIEAEHYGKAEILAGSSEDPVIRITDSADVKLIGCILGHSSISKYGEGCGGYYLTQACVVMLNKSQDIVIEQCDMYGCGTEGVFAKDSENIEVRNCVIRDCMRDIASAEGVNNLKYIDCLISGNAYDEEDAKSLPAFGLKDAQASLDTCVFMNNSSAKFCETPDDLETKDCVFYNNAWDGEEERTYGVCLNGITWQVENKVLKLGYPIHMSDGTTFDSKKGSVLNYSMYSKPWRKCSYDKVEVAEGVQYDEKWVVIVNISDVDINLTVPMTNHEFEDAFKSKWWRVSNCQEAVENGEKVTVEINITNSWRGLDIDEYVRAEGLSIAQYFDIESNFQVGENYESTIYQTDEPVRFVIDVPEHLQQGRPAIVRERNGSVELLEDLDDNSSTITIETDRLSEYTYALAYVGDKQPEIITTTQDLNMEDVVRVKYVPYSYTIETDNTDTQNQVTFSLEEGRLPEGLQIYPATGEIYGVPVEVGEFPITVKASYSNPDFEPSYAKLTVTVLDNTDNNVYSASDTGYGIKVPLGVETEAGSNLYTVTESGDQLFVSEGEMREFVGLWLNGQKLEESKDYSAESGSTRITVYGETFENKADRDGVNTIAAEFRVNGEPSGELRRTAQNFKLNLGGNTGNNGDTGNKGDSGNTGNIGNTGNVTVINGMSGSTSNAAKASQSAAGKNGSVTAIWQMVDAAGQPYQDITVELHSTPMTAQADARGLTVFYGVEGGKHSLTVKDKNGAAIAGRNFELVFGDGFRIEGEKIIVKAGYAFTVTVQLDNGSIAFIGIQEGDIYRVIAPRTDDAENSRRLAMAVLFGSMGAALCLYGKKRRFTRV